MPEFDFLDAAEGPIPYDWLEKTFADVNDSLELIAEQTAEIQRQQELAQAARQKSDELTGQVLRALEELMQAARQIRGLESG